MQELHWIQKIFIGASGTFFSIAIEEVSTITSVVAGIFTITYMLQQIAYMHMKRNASLAEWQHEKDEREYQRSIRKKNINND